MLAVVTISYFSLDSAGGSGYLGAFLAGLIVGNMERLGLAMHSQHEQEMRLFAFNVADLVTLFVFVVLGANIPFGALGDNLLPALAVLATLLLVARPLTVLACTLPDRRRAGPGRSSPSCAGRARPASCRRRWSGCWPASASRTATLYASVVALAIIVTLLLQALPAPWLAERLGLLEPRTREVPTAAPEQEAA